MDAYAIEAQEILKVGGAAASAGSIQAGSKCGAARMAGPGGWPAEQQAAPSVCAPSVCQGHAQTCSRISRGGLAGGQSGRMHVHAKGTVRANTRRRMRSKCSAGLHTNTHAHDNARRPPARR